jgi:phenylpropionate dioxygenase-like ring-hydroxylating dioxygenase large terminal subunit
MLYQCHGEALNQVVPVSSRRNQRELSMLATQQPVLRRFWYPVMPLSMLTDGPKPFRLLGEDIVLWRVGPDEVACVGDRCCHRSARLSRGFCRGDRLVCGYHGWEYDAAGRVVRIPQHDTGDDHVSSRLGTPSYRATARYGYVWVALAEPLYAFPEFEEATTEGFRQIDQFYEVWNCAGLRLMENSFDNAHFSFVHRGTFGDEGHPQPAKLEIDRFDDGFLMRSSAPVRNPDLQKSLLKIASDVTVRHMRARWYMPFLRKLQITYPNGLVHSIVTAATPIDDRSSQIVQFCFRSDTEAEAPAAEVNAFDRAVTLEDQGILETTDFDVPLDQAGVESNMPSDQPGVLMRRMLLDLLEKHGETESCIKPMPPRRANFRAVAG